MLLKRILFVIACSGALLLAGCSAALTDPSGQGCVPLVSVQPETVRAGDTITVVVSPGCDSAAPADGWVIRAAPVGKLDQAVRVSTSADLASGFEIELLLPKDFPPGAAFAGLDDWDYSNCPDNASCASPSGDFVVTDLP
jgi:hypothetical protein